MHRYFIKTPWIVRKYFHNYVWRKETTAQEVFLTFDDGPHPVVTPWVLAQLKLYDVKATFFCIGDNVLKHPETYRQILNEGHAVGNHTFHHLNGWETSNDVYWQNIRKASAVIDSGLFRPPYGRITNKQAKGVAAAMNRTDAKIIMWDVLSADFDQHYTKEQCLKNVLSNYRPGSIIVFHDSEKAFGNLEFTLPRVLGDLQDRGIAGNKLW
jgi:peptidoglycan/xylan/chitin deacetylase (PgdA/CDA1 family)